MTPGSVIDLEVEKPAAGGRMIARHLGQVVLVSGAIPGERVKARVERVGRGVAFAEAVEIVDPSADRRATDADWRCGGSVLAHVDYGRQLVLKSEIVRDAFQRIARVPLAAPPRVAASPEAGYRLRARLHARDGRLGFYREGTHELCDAAATGQLSPAANAWLHEGQRLVFSAGSRARRALAAVEFAENIAGDQRACHLELHEGGDAGLFVRLAGGLVGLSAQTAGRRAPEIVAGDPRVRDTLRVEASGASEVTLQRDVRAFFQGNRFLLESMVRHVLAHVPAGPVLDLFAGVGLFGLSSAAVGRTPVTLVEGDRISGTDLLANAASFGDGVRVETRSVESFLAGAPRFPQIAHATVIVDPPRTGMSKDAISGLISFGPPRIVYVSCDVATLARDTRALLDAGYELGPLDAFDLFPNTAHVETVAVFAKSS